MSTSALVQLGGPRPAKRKEWRAGAEIDCRGLASAARRILSLAAAGIAAVALTAEAAPPSYAEGQVWAYKARPSDSGSLLKIQKITQTGAAKVYHISVIGVHFKRADIAGVLPHIPVSHVTLDTSVTHEVSGDQQFPSLSAVDEGIATWRKDGGGVFSLPVAEIVDIIDSQTSEKKH